MTTDPHGSRNFPEPHSTPAAPTNAKLPQFMIVRNHSSQRRVSARRSSLARLSIGITSSWLVGNIALPAYAATFINNSGIQFEQDTTLESNFVESHGAYQSTFGVINLDTKEKTPLLTETQPSDGSETIFKPSSFRSHLGTATDFKGTPGNAVPKPVAQYKFRANQRYVLYLESTYKGRPTGVVYSNNVLNPNREQQVQFAGGVNDLCTSGITIGWDDTGSRLVRNRQQEDRDFDDFVVQMKNTTCGIGSDQITPQPEPPPSVVAELPPAPSSGGVSPLWATPLLLLPLVFGSDRGGSNPDTPSGCSGGNCKPIPEPLTILGSGSAIAMAALMERRRKRKRK
ncbi:PEP-CTERM sorting domain-containing protein [Leptolyngbya sp. DQ-M1]|uniref:PEP-CTERM sorting domain-containing protein n=1 Tax=Leptolyngbya sp. DQ-M1 TaxID=2933920 RepID=UPI0032979298